MYTRKLFVRNFVIPSFSVGVVHAKSEQENKDDCDDTKKLIRPRELPLYVDPPSCVACSNTIESEDGFLLTTIRCARQEFQQVLEQARMIQVEASNVVDEVKKETEDVVHYLRQEENLLPRLGAIGLGGFAGYLLACRRGLIRKTLYSAAGATLIAALAYPTEAREITEEVTCEMKKYAVIGYHFLNGADVDWKKLDESCKKGGGGGVGRGADNQETTKSLQPGDTQTAEKGGTEQKEGSDVKHDCGGKQGGGEKQVGDKRHSGAEKFKSYTERCRERGGSCTRKKGESGICRDTKRSDYQQQPPVLTRPTDKGNAPPRRNCLQDRTKPEEGRPTGDAPLPGDPGANSVDTPGVVDEQRRSCRPPPGPSETPRNVAPDTQWPTCKGQGELPRAEMTPSGPKCPEGGNPCVRRGESPVIQQDQQQPPNWTQKCDCPDSDSTKAETSRSSSPNSGTSPDSATHTTPCPPSPIKHSVVTIRYPADPDSGESVVVKGSQPKEVSNEKAMPQAVPVSFPNSRGYRPFTPLKFWGRDQR